MTRKKTQSKKASQSVPETPSRARPAKQSATPRDTGFVATYRRLFSIHEIEESPTLQALCAASLFVFFISCYQWAGQTNVSLETVEAGQHTCWPHFQSCGDWYFFANLPHGYSQTGFYMMLFLVMVGVTFAIIKKRWVLVHAGLAILLIWEVLLIFMLSMAKRGNFDYYQVVLTTALLVLPLKLRFIKITFAVLYFLASSIKLNDGWVLGTYFSSMELGAPIFPDELIPLATNTVILMEMLGGWFLLSHNRLLQRGALAFFIVFHLYSGLLVWYRYPATIMPYLLILFLPAQERFVAPRSLKALPGWAMITALFALQSLPVLIEGDERYTMEGVGYGLYMFDTNHQCISMIEIEREGGDIKKGAKEQASARYRCEAWAFMFTAKKMCEADPSIRRIGWRFAHSVNGGPFREIVNEENACDLEYSWYRHNEWIKLPERDEARIVGYPVKNLYF